MNNGMFTGYFKLERETRQRDPLSRYLFIADPETIKLGMTLQSEVSVSSVLELSCQPMQMTLTFCEGFSFIHRIHKIYVKISRGFHTEIQC